MADFREKLYDGYFNSQSGRRLNKSLADKVKEDQTQLRHEILPQMQENRDASILDIGCGYGDWLLLLKENGYTHTEGIDISPEQIEIAKSLGITNVQVADVFEYLAQNPAKYDCITGIDIIEHFTKDELLRLLGLIRQALKPEGIAIFRTPNMDGLLASVYAYGDFTHSCLLNYSSAMQLAIASGFSGAKVLPSFMYVSGTGKEMLRKILWNMISIQTKLVLFATGRSTKGVLLTPNLVLVVRR